MQDIIGRACFDFAEREILHIHFPLRANLISSLISSNDIPVSPLSEAICLILSKDSSPLALTSKSSPALISKGIRFSRTTAFMKIVKAAVLLTPNSLQSLSKSFFRFSSTLIDIIDCPIIILFNHHKYTHYALQTQALCYTAKPHPFKKNRQNRTTEHIQINFIIFGDN